MAKMNFMKMFWTALSWAVYLTLTMVAFGFYNVTPDTVPFGPIGWAIIVELPRAFVGLWLMKLLRMFK